MSAPEEAVEMARENGPRIYGTYTRRSCIQNERMHGTEDPERMAK